LQLKRKEGRKIFQCREPPCRKASEEGGASKVHTLRNIQKKTELIARRQEKRGENALKRGEKTGTLSEVSPEGRRRSAAGRAPHEKLRGKGRKQLKEQKENSSGWRYGEKKGPSKCRIRVNYKLLSEQGKKRQEKIKGGKKRWGHPVS